MTLPLDDTDGPFCEDFTIATVVGDEGRLEAIGRYLVSRDGDIPLVRDELTALGDRPEQLSRTEAEAVIVGLLLGGAARKEGRSTPFMEGRFVIDTNRALQILEEQIVGLRAIEATASKERPSPGTRLIATTPTDLDIELPRSVSRLGTQLRSSILDADEMVRLANPYFDLDQRVIDHLSELPSRGITTRILTRQVVPGTDRYEVLKGMADQLASADRRNLEVRELFHRDVLTGRQAYATHAKALVVDDSICYIGSANLTVTSLSSNFELGVLLDGPEVATATAVFDAVFAAATPVRFEE